MLGNPTSESSSTFALKCDLGRWPGSVGGASLQLPAHSCSTLAQLLTSSRPWFPHLLNKDNRHRVEVSGPQGPCASKGPVLFSSWEFLIYGAAVIWD